MKFHLLPLFFLVAANVFANDVWQCVDERGNKEYKNKEANENCIKIDLTIPPVRAKKKSSTVSSALESKVALGMSKVQIEKILGKPTGLKRVETRSEIKEKWTYSNGREFTFKNNKLEIIQD